jgi:CelD/BcsL family acetyltransferase involved in cellulose biosynthesis
MNLSVVAFEPAQAETWDRFCQTAVNGTFLHTRRFLSYHGERFEDQSVLIYADNDLVGVLPAARGPDRSVVSHPGATFGGLVHQGWLLGARQILAFEAIAAHFKARGFHRLIYKAVPFGHMTVPAQDDSYALSRAGAYRVRCDLSSAIALDTRRPLSERRRRALRKSAAAVRVVQGREHLDEVWQTVAATLQREHDTKPVHSLEELRLLADRFPSEIAVYASKSQSGDTVAGVVLFNSKPMWHAQYIAASEQGYKLSALDAVFATVIDAAAAAGARYFDFGTSNENGGRVLNDGLYRFKSEFGGGGMVHEFFELAL